MRILIVEDEAKTSRQLQSGLQEAGYEVALAERGDQGLALASHQSFDAMVVDVMLPGLSGLQLVRHLRERGITTPALFLSARGDSEDRVRGLDAGGDDYLAKPYALNEVQARLRAILRRTGRTKLPERVEVADLVWEPSVKRVSRMGKRVDLTPKEYALAALLLEQRGEVVNRRQIMEGVWGLDIPADGNALDVQVRRLRAKLDDPFERKLIHTVRGIGIVLEDRGQ
ncbi:MAG TPA: response regulator [Holophagaceae bacterium]|nr:response regulator [Holophagaceae bacterium]